MDSTTLHMHWEDIVALGFFIACWLGYAAFSEHKSNSDGTLLAATNRYRLQWMREMLKRENRMMDATMVGNLLRSITFFANTTIFILLGLMTMLGYQEKLTHIFSSLPFVRQSDALTWELKIFVLIIIFIYAFFKYTWSLRQYNYAGIFITACPSCREDVEQHEAWAQKGAYMVANAAKHFNYGLRAYYFGLAVLAWFIHPYVFIVATSWVVFVLYRREYRSGTLKNLSN